MIDLSTPSRRLMVWQDRKKKGKGESVERRVLIAFSMGTTIYVFPRGLAWRKTIATLPSPIATLFTGASARILLCTPYCGVELLLQVAHFSSGHGLTKLAHGSDGARILPIIR